MNEGRPSGRPACGADGRPRVEAGPGGRRSFFLRGPKFRPAASGERANSSAALEFSSAGLKFPSSAHEALAGARLPRIVARGLKLPLQKLGVRELPDAEDAASQLMRTDAPTAPPGVYLEC